MTRKLPDAQNVQTPRQATAVLETLPTEPADAAQVAGLRYVSDDRPGIRRVRVGHGFRYVNPRGRPVHDAATLRRITELATEIPRCFSSSIQSEVA